MSIPGIGSQRHLLNLALIGVVLAISPGFPRSPAILIPPLLIFATGFSAISIMRWTTFPILVLSGVYPWDRWMKRLLPPIPSWWAEMGVRLLFIIGAMIVAYALLWLGRRLEFARRNPVAYAIVAFVIVVLVIPEFTHQSIGRGLIAGSVYLLAMLITFSFFSMVLELKQQNKVGYITPYYFLFPFFNQSYLHHNSFKEMLAQESVSGTESWNTLQKQTTTAIIGLSTATFVNLSLHYLMNSKLNMPLLDMSIPGLDFSPAWTIGEKHEDVGSWSFAKSWAMATIGLVYHIINIFLYFEMSRVILMCMGFNAESNFNEVFKATTLSQFYSRILHLYKKNLIYLFFLPFFRWAKKVGNADLRKGLAILFCIGVGGPVIHLMGLVRKLGPAQMGRYIEQMIHFQPYFLAIGITSGLSAVIEHKVYNLESETRWKKPARFLMYFVIYVIVTSLGFGLQRSKVIFDNLELFKKLIGF